MEHDLILIALLILTFVAFVLPIVIIMTGYDIVKPIKKILIWFGLMTGLVKMRKND